MRRSAAVHPQTQPAALKRAWVWVGIAAGAAVIVLIVVVVSSVVFRDTRQDIDLGEFGPAGAGDAAMADYDEATDELCEDEPGCVQAYESEHVDYYKFDSEDRAVAYADSHNDTYQSNWIVIHYTDEALTSEEQDRLEMYVDSIATSG
jgi:hypothetical protein